jgi:hypothetical protein
MCPLISSLSTYIPRVLQCLFPRPNSPPPLPQASVSLPRNQKGRHTRLRVRGWGSPNSDDWRKSLALCLLCGFLAFAVSSYISTLGLGCGLCLILYRSIKKGNRSTKAKQSQFLLERNFIMYSDRQLPRPFRL